MKNFFVVIIGIVASALSVYFALQFFNASESSVPEEYAIESSASSGSADSVTDSNPVFMNFSDVQGVVGHSVVFFFCDRTSQDCKDNEAFIAGLYASGSVTMDTYRVFLDDPPDAAFVKTEGVKHANTFILTNPDGSTQKMLVFPTNEKIEALLRS